MYAGTSGVDHPIAVAVLSLLATSMVLIAAQVAFNAVTVWRLRRRYPALDEQRAYLVRGTHYYHPCGFNETEHLQRLARHGRWWGGDSLIFPWLFLSELIRHGMGLGNDSMVGRRIDWAGLLIGLAAMAFCGARRAAMGRLARDVLRQELPSSPTTPAAATT